MSDNGSLAVQAINGSPRHEPVNGTVLLVSLFHPELVRGGAQQICYELFQGLRDGGEVRPVLLASVDSNFPALFKSGARITGFDGKEDEFLFLSRSYDYMWHRVQEPLLVDSYAEFLEDIRPEAVHFHHFLTYGVDFITLTRRVLPEAKIVFTFHEFLAICMANGHMVRTADGALCDHASQVRCHQCFPERAPEDFFSRKMWFQKHLENVDIFTCPSGYMLDRYVAWGIPESKIRIVTNGQRNYADNQRIARVSHPGRTARRNRFGFFGQLVDIKGVQVLLKAAELLRADGFTDFRIDINGSNDRYATEPVRAEIRAFMEAESKRPATERLVVFNGEYDVAGLGARMERIDWCVVPSLWWEAFVLVISEAWMFGKPVICSNVGAMAERVRDDVNGLLFEMGDARSLAETIRRAASEDGLWDRLGGALPAPPSREDMVQAFRGVYGL
ncbi:MAG TPA: glycosyltransferase family 4 protein [Rhizomicrobium sp.]|jgi:glycosyltransferase involved in cell wall biosynthesis|nr:glycosyltransferase family 4 protein [Rhizomicrobium sp.]